LHKGLPTSGKCPDDAPELGRTSDERRRFGLRFSERASLGFASRTTRATRSFAERRCSGEVGPEGRPKLVSMVALAGFLVLTVAGAGLGISGVDGRRSFQDRDPGLRT